MYREYKDEQNKANDSVNTSNLSDYVMNNLMMNMTQQFHPRRKQLNISRLSTNRISLRVENSRAIAQQINKDNARRILGAVVLVCAIVGGSSIGTIANFIPVESSFAKNAWRSGIIVSIFALPALIEYFYKRDTVNYSKLMNFK